MHFLNSIDYAPAATDPSDASFKDTITNHAKTLNAHDLSSLSGKYGSDIMYATIFGDPKGHKAILEAVKVEIDALLETKLVEQANESKRSRSVKPDGQGQGEGESQISGTPSTTGKKKTKRATKSESLQKMSTRRSARLSLVKEIEEEGGESERNQEPDQGETSAPDTNAKVHQWLKHLDSPV